MTATTKTQQPFTEAEAAAWTAREEAEIARLEALRKSGGMGADFHRQRRRAELERVQIMTKRAAPAGPPQSALDKMAEARKHRHKAEILASSNPKKNRKAIKDHLNAATRAEREAARLQAEASDSDWAHRANQETEDLALARGEPVKVSGDGKRIMTRNGIMQAYEDGHMDPPHGPLKKQHLLSAALAYREAYSAAAPGSSGAAEAGGGFKAKGPQVRIVEAGQALAIMRQGLGKRQVDVLDRVCGLDMRLREAATVLRRGFPSTQNSLVSGLQLACLNLKAARALKKSDEPTTKERLESAAAQIDQAMRAAR